MTLVSDFMTGTKTFSEAFKKLRLQAGIDSLRELCEILVSFGFILEESTLSRWQNGSRIPKNRQLLLGLIKVFAINNAISSVEEANKLLYLAQLMPLSNNEIKELSLKNKKHLVFVLPPEPDIIGTDTIFEEVRKALEKDNNHLRVVLWGLPGTGKSSTAISLGYNFQSFFQKGIVWIRVLDKSISDIIQELNQILVSNLPSDFQDEIPVLTRSKDLLIIFDNVSDEPTFNEIIKHFSYASYLVTTGFYPSVSNHFSVIKVDSFDTKYAIELFSRAAGRALSKSEIEIITKISNQAGNLPLPLTIIANTLQNSLNEKNLEMTLNLIKRKQEGLPFFQENFSQIIIAFELLFEQLSSDEKLVLKTIATKRLPTFKVDSLVSEELDISRIQWALFTLNNKSLIDKTTDGGYRIHPVLYRFLRIKND